MMEIWKKLSEYFCREIRWRGWFDYYYFDITPIEKHVKMEL
jgi:hypothetical protein